MWYGVDFLEKMLSTYCVSPAGRYLGMSLLSWGLAQGFAASYYHEPASIRTGQVGREILIEEATAERRAVRGVGREAGTNC